MTQPLYQYAPENAFSTSSEDPRLDLDLVPGPEPLPLVGAHGNLVSFFFDPLRYINSLAYGGYGNVVSFARGMRRGILWPEERSPGAVFAFGRELAEQILIKRAEASFRETVVVEFPADRPDAARLNGGLLWLSGEPHRQRRKLVVPLYHARRISRWRDLMVDVFGRAIDRWVPDQPIEIMKESGEMLVEFQNDAVLGIGRPSGELAHMGDRVCQLLNRFSDPRSFIVDLPGTPRRQMKDLADRVSKDLATVIRAKRAEAEESDDVLSMMVRGVCEDGHTLSDDELIAETFGLYIGGWASTRPSMAWTLLMLAQHPKVAADLTDELTSKLKGDAPTVEQLKELPFLDAVVKESHRLFPPIPMVTRIATEEVELGGYRLPRRTELFISIYHTHREPEIFPEPLRFRPSRWENLNPGPYEYLPFGIGARVCPGNALAIMQMKILLAMMMQRFRYEPLWNTKVDCVGIGVVKPKPDIRLIVRNQDRRFVRSRTNVRGNVNAIVDLGL